MEITIGNSYTLKADVKSVMRPGYTYGFSGEKVKVLSISNHVAIVESQKGVKMPVIIDEHLKID